MTFYNLYTHSRLLELAMSHAFSYLEPVYEVKSYIYLKGRKIALCSFVGLTERILGFIDGLERIAGKSEYILNEIESNKTVRLNKL